MALTNLFTHSKWEAVGDTSLEDSEAGTSHMSLSTTEPASRVISCASYK